MWIIKIKKKLNAFSSSDTRRTQMHLLLFTNSAQIQNPIYPGTKNKFTLDTSSMHNFTLDKSSMHKFTLDISSMHNFTIEKSSMHKFTLEIWVTKTHFNDLKHAQIHFRNLGNNKLTLMIRSMNKFT